MRFGGMGLLILGALLGLGSVGYENAAGAQYVLLLGGFIFLAGAVFMASAGIQDAIKRHSR